MQWLDSSDVRTKLAAIFLYLNNGKDINVGMISSLLKHAYPETKEVRTRSSDFNLTKLFFLPCV